MVLRDSDGSGQVQWGAGASGGGASADVTDEYMHIGCW